VISHEIGNGPDPRLGSVRLVFSGAFSALDDAPRDDASSEESS